MENVIVIPLRFVVLLIFCLGLRLIRFSVISYLFLKTLVLGWLLSVVVAVVLVPSIVWGVSAGRAVLFLGIPLLTRFQLLFVFLNTKRAATTERLIQIKDEKKAVPLAGSFFRLHVTDINVNLRIRLRNAVSIRFYSLLARFPWGLPPPLLCEKRQRAFTVDFEATKVEGLATFVASSRSEKCMDFLSKLCHAEKLKKDNIQQPLDLSGNFRARSEMKALILLGVLYEAIQRFRLKINYITAQLTLACAVPTDVNNVMKNAVKERRSPNTSNLQVGLRQGLRGSLFADPFVGFRFLSMGISKLVETAAELLHLNDDEIGNESSHSPEPESQDSTLLKNPATDTTTCHITWVTNIKKISLEIEKPAQPLSLTLKGRVNDTRVTLTSSNGGGRPSPPRHLLELQSGIEIVADVAGKVTPQVSENFRLKALSVTSKNELRKEATQCLVDLSLDQAADLCYFYWRWLMARYPLVLVSKAPRVDIGAKVVEDLFPALFGKKCSENDQLTVPISFQLDCPILLRVEVAEHPSLLEGRLEGMLAQLQVGKCLVGVKVETLGPLTILRVPAHGLGTHLRNSSWWYQKALSVHGVGSEASLDASPRKSYPLGYAPRLSLRLVMSKKPVYKYAQHVDLRIPEAWMSWTTDGVLTWIYFFLHIQKVYRFGRVSVYTTRERLTQKLDWLLANEEKNAPSPTQASNSQSQNDICDRCAQRQDGLWCHAGRRRTREGNTEGESSLSKECRMPGSLLLPKVLCDLDIIPTLMSGPVLKVLQDNADIFDCRIDQLWVIMNTELSNDTPIPFGQPQSKTANPPKSDPYLLFSIAHLLVYYSLNSTQGTVISVSKGTLYSLSRERLTANLSKGTSDPLSLWLSSPVTFDEPTLNLVSSREAYVAHLCGRAVEVVLKIPTTSSLNFQQPQTGPPRYAFSFHAGRVIVESNPVIFDMVWLLTEGVYVDYLVIRRWAALCVKDHAIPSVGATSDLLVSVGQMAVNVGSHFKIVGDRMLLTKDGPTSAVDVVMSGLSVFELRPRDRPQPGVIADARAILALQKFRIWSGLDHIPISTDVDFAKSCLKEEEVVKHSSSCCCHVVDFCQPAKIIKLQLTDLRVVLDPELAQMSSRATKTLKKFLSDIAANCFPPESLLLLARASRPLPLATMCSLITDDEKLTELRVLKNFLPAPLSYLDFSFKGDCSVDLLRKHASGLNGFVPIQTKSLQSSNDVPKSQRSPLVTTLRDPWLFNAHQLDRKPSFSSLLKQVKNLPVSTLQENVVCIDKTSTETERLSARSQCSIGEEEKQDCLFLLSETPLCRLQIGDLFLRWSFKNSGATFMCTPIKRIPQSHTKKELYGDLEVKCCSEGCIKSSGVLFRQLNEEFRGLDNIEVVKEYLLAFGTESFQINITSLKTKFYDYDNPKAPTPLLVTSVCQKYQDSPDQRESVVISLRKFTSKRELRLSLNQTLLGVAPCVVPDCQAIGIFRLPEDAYQEIHRWHIENSARVEVSLLGTFHSLRQAVDRIHEVSPFSLQKSEREITEVRRVVQRVTSLYFGEVFFVWSSHPLSNNEAAQLHFPHITCVLSQGRCRLHAEDCEAEMAEVSLSMTARSCSPVEASLSTKRPFFSLGRTDITLMLHRQADSQLVPRLKCGSLCVAFEGWETPVGMCSSNAIESKPCPICANGQSPFIVDLQPYHVPLFLDLLGPKIASKSRAKPQSLDDEAAAPLSAATPERKADISYTIEGRHLFMRFGRFRINVASVHWRGNISNLRHAEDDTGLPIQEATETATSRFFSNMISESRLQVKKFSLAVQMNSALTFPCCCAINKGGVVLPLLRIYNVNIVIKNASEMAISFVTVRHLWNVVTIPSILSGLRRWQIAQILAADYLEDIWGSGPASISAVVPKSGPFDLSATENDFAAFRVFVSCKDVQINLHWLQRRTVQDILDSNETDWKATLKAALQTGTTISKSGMKQREQCSDDLLLGNTTKKQKLKAAFMCVDALPIFTRDQIVKSPSVGLHVSVLQPDMLHPMLQNDAFTILAACQEEILKRQQGEEGNEESQKENTSILAIGSRLETAQWRRYILPKFLGSSNPLSNDSCQFVLATPELSLDCNFQVTVPTSYDAGGLEHLRGRSLASCSVAAELQPITGYAADLNTGGLLWADPPPGAQTFSPLLLSPSSLFHDHAKSLAEWMDSPRTHQSDDPYRGLSSFRINWPKPFKPEVRKSLESTSSKGERGKEPSQASVGTTSRLLEPWLHTQRVCRSFLSGGWPVFREVSIVKLEVPIIVLTLTSQAAHQLSRILTQVIVNTDLLPRPLRSKKLPALNLPDESQSEIFQMQPECSEEKLEASSPPLTLRHPFKLLRKRFQKSSRGDSEGPSPSFEFSTTVSKQDMLDQHADTNSSVVDPSMFLAESGVLSSSSREDQTSDLPLGGEPTQDDFPVDVERANTIQLEYGFHQFSLSLVRDNCVFCRLSAASITGSVEWSLETTKKSQFSFDLADIIVESVRASRHSSTTFPDEVLFDPEASASEPSPVAETSAALTNIEAVNAIAAEVARGGKKERQTSETQTPSLILPKEALMIGRQTNKLILRPLLLGQEREELLCTILISLRGKSHVAETPFSPQQTFTKVYDFLILQINPVQVFLTQKLIEDIYNFVFPVAAIQTSKEAAAVLNPRISVNDEAKPKRWQKFKSQNKQPTTASSSILDEEDSDEKTMANKSYFKLFRIAPIRAKVDFSGNALNLKEVEFNFRPFCSRHQLTSTRSMIDRFLWTLGKQATAAVISHKLKVWVNDKRQTLARFRRGAEDEQKPLESAVKPKGIGALLEKFSTTRDRGADKPLAERGFFSRRGPKPPEAPLARIK